MLKQKYHIAKNILKTPSRSYLVFFISIFSVLFFPIFLGNLYLNYVSYFTSQDIDIQASVWQERTRGIACTSDSTNRIFKTLRLQSMLKQEKVDTILLGSSTVMGIKDSMFPKDQKFYNFSQNTNPTRCLIAELEYLIQQKNLTHFIISLDWVLGFPMHTSKIPENIFNTIKKEDISWKNLIKDALTNRKAKLFLDKILTILRSETPLQTFKKVFLLTNEEYKCPNGQVARDFNSSYPQQCAGFCYDGSTDSLLHRPLSEEQRDEIIHASITTKYPYIVTLSSSAGVNPEYFNKLSEHIKEIKIKNTDIFFLLPPLLPGLEKKILETPQKEKLLQIKNFLNQFALDNQIQILDAGQSEEYGCTASDFLDSHHAYAACYQKILPRFFAHRHTIGNGLISPIFGNLP